MTKNQYKKAQEMIEAMKSLSSALGDSKKTYKAIKNLENKRKQFERSK